jgi:hypothetical protein
MTDEEAIKEIREWIEDDGAGEISIISLSLALSALRERIERRNPQPLTDEDLERMGGNPVWISGGGEGFWMLSADADDYIDELNAMRSERPAHAYRAKPLPPEQEAPRD